MERWADSSAEIEESMRAQRNVGDDAGEGVKRLSARWRHFLWSGSVLVTTGNPEGLHRLVHLISESSSWPPNGGFR